METIWIVAEDLPDGLRIYLGDFAGSTPDKIKWLIKQAAMKEGFKGRVEEYMQEANWSIVKVKVEEVTTDITISEK